MSTSLTEVQIPASVQNIGRSAFYQCENLQRVAFAEGSQLREIKVGAFSCTGLTKVQIPVNVQSIGACAF